MVAIHGDDIIPEGKSEAVGRLDDVLKRSVSVKPLGQRFTRSRGARPVFETPHRVHEARASSGYKIQLTAQRSSRTVPRSGGATSEKDGHLVEMILRLWTSCQSKKRRCTSKTHASTATCQVGDLTKSSA